MCTTESEMVGFVMFIFRYFLITSNYFFYGECPPDKASLSLLNMAKLLIFFSGESLVDQFGLLINRTEFLPFLVRYHRFISFSM
jgi:hypothetical protein